MDTLGGLRRDGIVAVHGPDFLGKEACDKLDANLFAFRDDGEVAELQGYFERGEYRPDVLKPHMVKTDQIGWELELFDEVGRLPCVTDPVAAFLGNYRLHSCNGWWFFPRPYERERVWSESWHRDPESPRLVKTFYFPEAVDVESGPLQYIPASRVGQPLEKLCPPGVYPTCDIDSLVHPDCVLTCTVPAQTFMFVDTSGLHRGGFTKSKGRLCASWCYLPVP